MSYFLSCRLICIELRFGHVKRKTFHVKELSRKLVKLQFFQTASTASILKIFRSICDLVLHRYFYLLRDLEALFQLLLYNFLFWLLNGKSINVS